MASITCFRRAASIVGLAIVAWIAPGAALAASESSVTITRNGHLQSSSLQKERVRIMRHDQSKRESEETLQITSPGDAELLARLEKLMPSPNPASVPAPVPPSPVVTPNETAPDPLEFHAFDAGGNCPMVGLLRYPTRFDRDTMICLDDNTASPALRIDCHEAGPSAGENRVVYAYKGKVNNTEIIKRYAKVSVPRDGDTYKPVGGWPVMILFHATLPLQTVMINGQMQADDAKAPEQHFDGILHNAELEGVMSRMVVVVPAGFDRYRFDGPPYNECDPAKYRAEFNYLQSVLGRTRHSNADDIRFLASIMNWLHLAGGATPKIDLSKVYVTGHSTGAHMASFMMTQYLFGNTDDSVEFPIAGGAASAGSFLTCLTDPRIARGDNGNWIGLGPRPFMYFQGLQDIASWCGGGGNARHMGEHMYSVEQMAYAFAERNKCATNPDGFFRMKHWEITPEMDTDLSQRVHLWEFRSCESPLVIYTFPGLDHVLQSVNTFMFKKKMKFFLGDWEPPASGGLETVLNTKNGTNMCGCCNQATGQCDPTTRCNSRNYLQAVSCPSSDEITKSCWSSSDLDDAPVCWWVGRDMDEESMAG